MIYVSRSVCVCMCILCLLVHVYVQTTLYINLSTYINTYLYINANILFTFTSSYICFLELFEVPSNKTLTKLKVSSSTILLKDPVLCTSYWKPSEHTLNCMLLFTQVSPQKVAIFHGQMPSSSFTI